MPGAAHGLPHEAPAPARLLDAEGLAARISVSVPAVRAMLKRRQIPAEAVVHLGRRLRFDEQAVDRWIEWLRAEEADRNLNPTSSGARK
jgi:excisionase family DNA binding protein